MAALARCDFDRNTFKTECLSRVVGLAGRPQCVYVGHHMEVHPKDRENFDMTFDENMCLKHGRWVVHTRNVRLERASSAPVGHYGQAGALFSRGPFLTWRAQAQASSGLYPEVPGADRFNELATQAKRRLPGPKSAKASRKEVDAK